MEITNVKVWKQEREGSHMRGFAQVTLDDQFVVKDIRVIDGRDGLFIAMPSRTLPNGEHKDIAHPITQEVRDMFTKKILEAYEEAEDYVADKKEETEEEE